MIKTTFIKTEKYQKLCGIEYLWLSPLQESGGDFSAGFYGVIVFSKEVVSSVKKM